MKIVLWIGGGANQKALANKIHAAIPLAGIVLEKRKQKRKITIPGLFEKVIEKLFLSPIGKSWWQMMQSYNSQYPSYPEAPLIEVENINASAAYEFTSDISPDVVIVSGTRMVRKKMLSIQPPIGILNLHTGLSPYIKGGPNCTNWCIATDQYHMIGNTIMWIDAGIDTGNIIATEFTDFEGDEQLPEVQSKVMEHAHSLYVSTILKLSEGNQVPNVPQMEIAEGVTYYTKQWGLKEKIKLVRNLKAFRKSFKEGTTEKLREGVKIIKA